MLYFVGIIAVLIFIGLCGVSMDNRLGFIIFLPICWTAALIYNVYSFHTVPGSWIMVEDPYGPWVKGILILAGLFFLVFGLSDYICPTANRNSKEESQ